MADVDRGSDPPGEDGDDPASFRRRTLEHTCAQQQMLLFVFVLSAVVLFISLLLIGFADVSEGSAVIAVVNVLITGPLFAGALAVIWRCRRLERGR